MKTVIVLVYEIDSEDYPTLNGMEKNRLQYFIEQGGLDIDDDYGKIPPEETFLQYPVSLTILKGAE